MKSKSLFVLFIFWLQIFSATSFAKNLSHNFVYLHAVAPTIQQDIRYAGKHNFVGRPIAGYQANECILTTQAALALAAVQKELEKSSLSLKVYDCYRPQMAVEDFIAWSQRPEQQQMKNEFYPRINKADFFKLGYVALKSGHTRGSTVDLTIVPVPTLQEATYHPGEQLLACYSSYQRRYRDNSIDMGTGYDCMDPTANVFHKGINTVAAEHRLLLRHLMEKYGFVPFELEWWHFTYKNEPYPNTYFNFPITSK